MNVARDSAHELLEVGRVLNDPRSTGFGLYLLSYIALFSDSYDEALAYSEQSLAVVVTPMDRLVALGAKAFALVLLGRVREGIMSLEEYRRGFVALGYLNGYGASDVPFGICKIFQGNITKGLHLVEQAVIKHENEGLPSLADLFRLNLAEVYLQIIGGEQKPPLSVILKNLPILVRVLISAPARIQALTAHVLQNPNFDPAGYHAGRAQMILGLLYKAKKKRALAVQHLNDATRITSQFGPTPMLAKIKSALAELV